MKYADRKKFLASKEWKEHRLKIASKDLRKDYITKKKLQKGWVCHHLLLDKEEYTDLENRDNFISLSKRTHELLHYFFIYYKKDPAVLDRLKEILDLMLELNS